MATHNHNTYNKINKTPYIYNNSPHTKCSKSHYNIQRIQQYINNTNTEITNTNKYNNKIEFEK